MCHSLDESIQVSTCNKTPGLQVKEQELDKRLRKACCLGEEKRRRRLEAKEEKFLQVHFYEGTD